MNPLELLIAGLRGEPAAPVASPLNDPEMPGLMPGAPSRIRGHVSTAGIPEALAARGEPTPSPISLLRSLLQGNDAGAPDPEGAALGASISKAMPPAPAQTPGTTLGSMPAPSSDPSRRAMFEQQPPAASAPAVGSWQTTSAPGAVPAQAGGGIKPADVQSFVRALMMGASGVNPTAPKFSAFAQGAAGAMGQQYKETEAEKAR